MTASLVTVHQYPGSPSIEYSQRKHNCLSVQIRYDSKTLILARNKANCTGKYAHEVGEFQTIPAITTSCTILGVDSFSIQVFVSSKLI